MSLFPFLVVLICTMGALILLLVIIARQARLQAAEDSAARGAEVHKEIEDARQWAQLEIREYRYSREKTESQRTEARLALGHVEDHIRRLRRELARLEATWGELQSVHEKGADRREARQAEIDRLKAQIAQAELDLAEAREAAEGRRSYAVVPYQGPHATHRRPIYVECRRDAVVLQPEGIVLEADDFAGPLGSGNPLDVALRAVREYLLRHQGFDPEKTGEPYPLLLVRPQGTAAYYAARAAMESWASDFGYELIGDDWQLEFPSPDPQLAEEVAEAVATARVRQRRLIAAAPSRFARRSQAAFVASPYSGGLVPHRGSSDQDASAYQSGRPFRRFGSQFAPGKDHGEGPMPGPSSAGSAPAPEEGQTGQPAGGGPSPAGRPTPESASDAAGCALASAADRPQSLAKARGRNWGLPNAAEGWVPITVPIRIDCLSDRLILVPEKGMGQPRAIALGHRTQDAVDELISAVWEYVERWGSAGNGMYWRPVLSLDVAPDAESRYTDLKTLLDGSGLGVERTEEGARSKDE
jgi:hypothetical protein